MTESRSKPALPAARATLPGAAPSLRFEVIVTTVAVLIREWLKASPETTRTGRRQAGADPRFGPKSANQTSPRATTFRQLLCVGLRPTVYREMTPQLRRSLLMPWLRPSRAPGATNVPALARRTRCARHRACVHDARLVERVDLGSRLQSSRSQYNQVIPANLVALPKHFKRNPPGFSRLLTARATTTKCRVQRPQR